MTVENQTKKVTGTGNDSATVFSFSPMVIFASTDLVVTKLDVDGVETLLVEGASSTTYSVAPVSSYPGIGSVTYPASGGTPLATGESIVMKRILTIEQLTDLENQGGYHADTQETVYDKLTMIDLQQQEELDRSLKSPSSDPAVNLEFPSVADRANLLLGFNGAGEPIATGIAAAITDLSNHTALVAGSTTARTLAARFANIINVLDYGATGDGSTDDTVAINAAIDAAEAAGGGTVTGPPGTYMASQIVVKRLVILDGGHFASFELKQIASSNKDFIVSENFATLTGTNKYAPFNTDVPFWFGLKDIRIDGNKANQTSGNGISFYGSNMMMLGTVYVTDCKDDNIYTEGPAAATETTFASFVGGYFDDVISIRAGAYGWQFVGPMNSQLKSYRCIVDDPGNYGFYSHNAGGEAFAVFDVVGHMHIYGTATGTNRLGYKFAGGAGYFANINADSVNILIDTPSPDTGTMRIGSITLTGVGKHSTNNLGLEVNDSSVKIDQINASTSTNVIGGGDPTGVICVQWDGANGFLGQFNAFDNGNGASNTALKVVGGQGQFYGLNFQNFTGAGSLGLDLAGSGHKVRGRIQSCKGGYTYAAGGQNEVDLEIFLAAGQTAAAGSTPGSSDRFDINTSGDASLRTKKNLLSGTFAIDSTGKKTITIAHGALYQPTNRQVQASIVSATQDDWVVDNVYVPMPGATNITVVVNIGTASGTGSATAKVAVRYDVGGA